MYLSRFIDIDQVGNFALQEDLRDLAPSVSHVEGMAT